MHDVVRCGPRGFEEKRAPAKGVDTAVVDNRKVLDVNRPSEADRAGRSRWSQAAAWLLFPKLDRRQGTSEAGCGLPNR
jgi:hypothetical protein